MWQALYERLRQAQSAQSPAHGPAADVTTLRHPPASDEPRCPHCPGVRLVAAADAAHLRCVWCTRVYARSELEAA